MNNHQKIGKLMRFKFLVLFIALALSSCTKINSAYRVLRVVGRYGDDVLRVVGRNGDDVYDVLRVVGRNGDEFLYYTDDVIRILRNNGDELIVYADDVAKILNPVRQYRLSGRKITRYADDVVVIRKPNGELVIGRSPSHIIVPQFNSLTPFEKLDDATVIAFQKTADRAAIDAVNQALSKDISQESLEILAEQAAKREIIKDILIRQKTTKSFVIITSVQLNELANQSAEKALQEVKESEVSYINKSYLS